MRRLLNAVVVAGVAGAAVFGCGTSADTPSAASTTTTADPFAEAEAKLDLIETLPYQEALRGQLSSSVWVVSTAVLEWNRSQETCFKVELRDTAGELVQGDQFGPGCLRLGEDDGPLQLAGVWPVGSHQAVVAGMVSDGVSVVRSEAAQAQSAGRVFAVVVNNRSAESVQDRLTITVNGRHEECAITARPQMTPDCTG